MQTLYLRIGQAKIEEIIRSFYERSFSDPMLSHFFWNVDREHLISMQIAFASNMLGGPKQFRGTALKKAHEKLQIRRPHIRRRQRILEECMAEKCLEIELAREWLRLEERFLELVLSD